MDTNTLESRSTTSTPVSNEKQVSTEQTITQAIEAKDVNVLNAHIDSVGEKAIPKELAWQMAGITDAEGKPTEGTMGGYPKTVLREVEKFDGLTAQEVALKLIETQGNAFGVFDLESDYDKAQTQLGFESGRFEKLKQDGYKPEDQEYIQAESLLQKLTRFAEKIKQVKESLDKGTLLDTAIATKNLLTPDRMEFFKKGSNAVTIESEVLIDRLLAAGYSSGYLRGFVEAADTNSLSVELAQKLAQRDEIMLGDLPKTYPNKFKETPTN